MLMDLNDKKLAYALTVLRADDNFRKVRQGIENRLEEAATHLAHVRDGVELRMAQGRCQELQDILKSFDDAPVVYEKLRTNR